MATLFNTKISVTYPGLLKTIDNAALSATLKELTDGSGNQSGLYLNTAGDFKVTSILEWGSLKDTGTGVTITQFVTQANGIANFDNDTTIPTSAAVKDYVDTKFSQTDTLAEVLGFGNTTSGTDIAVSANDDITFTDSSKILMGAGSDLQIYHDGNNSLIKDTGTGVLYIGTDAFRITSANLSENMISAFEDGAVNLYYNNSLKIATTNTGVDVTGNLVVSGTITGSGGSFLPLAGGTMTGNIVLNDNVKSIYGTSNDGLEIYHDGSNSYIDETGTGSLYIKSAGAIRLQSQTGENMIYAVNDSAVNLYFNNSNKFQTTISGANVSGSLSTTSNVTVGANATFVDNGKAIFGAGSDLIIEHTGTFSRIQENGTGDLIIQGENLTFTDSSGTDTYANFTHNAGVSFRYDNAIKLETVTAGAKVTGNLEVTGTITGSGGSFLPLAGGTMTGNTIHNDNVKSIYGTSSDGLEIFHDGTDSFISDTGTGNLLVRAGSNFEIEDSDGINMARFLKDNKVELYYDGSIKIETTNTGIQVNGNAALSAGFSIPDNQYGKFGTGDDIIIGHDSTNSIIRSSTGDLFIDQSAVTKSMIFRVSNANALDTTALTINREGDLTTGADVTIAGNLTVNGTTTTINTQTLAVEDPLIELSKDNTANSVDIGFYGKYNDGTARYLGLFSDASDSNKFRLFKGTTVQPTTTVNIAGSGYEAADLVVAGLEASNDVSIVKSSAVNLRVSDGTQNVYVGSSGSARFGLGSGASIIQSTGAAFGIGTQDGNALRLGTNNTEVLTLDTSSNASFTGDVSLLDAKVLKLGTSADLQLFHESNNSFISNNIGDLTIRNIANDKDIIFQSDNGSGGVATYFFLDGSATQTTFQLDTKHNDNVKAKFGDSSDLQIYHDGSNSYIDETGTGGLVIKTGDFYLRNPSDAEIIRASSGASVELYYNGLKKFETTSTGFNATGSGRFRGEASPRIKAVGNTATGYPGFMLSNTGQEYEIIVGGNDSNKFKIRSVSPSAADLLTIESGGNSTFAGDVNLANLKSIYLGTSSALRIYTDSATAYLRGDDVRLTNAANDSIIRVNGDIAELYYNDVKKFETTTSGIAVTGVVKLTGTNNFTIESNNTAATFNLVSGARGYDFINDNGTLLSIGNNGSGTFSGSVTSTEVKVVNSTGTSTLYAESDTLALLQLKDDGLDKIYNIEIGRSSTAGDLTFRSSGGEKVRFTEAGNVGINTDNPDSKITIQNDAATSQRVLNIYHNNVTANGYASIGAQYTRTNRYVESEIRFGSETLNGACSYLGFVTGCRNDGANTEKMRISSDGNVTIGNTASVQPLTVAGNVLFRTSTVDGFENRFQFLPGGSGDGGTFYVYNNGETPTIILKGDGGSTFVSSAPSGTPLVTIENNSGSTATSYGLLVKGGGGSASGKTFEVRDSSGNQDFLVKGNGIVEIGGNNAQTNAKLDVRNNGSVIEFGHSNNGGRYFGTVGSYGSNGQPFISFGTFCEQSVNTFTTIDGKGNIITNDSSGNLIFQQVTSAAATGQTPVDRMRITSSGNFLFNTTNQSLYNSTSDTGISMVSKEFGVANTGTQAYFNRIGSDGLNVVLFNRGTNVGNISTTSSATTFNTSSDYRLKEDLQDFAGLDMVSKIPVYDFKWKSDESRSYGVMAHELQEVLPQAVTGEKDAEEMQSVDYSKIVPLLVKSIQELKKEIEDLKCKCKN